MRRLRAPSGWRVSHLRPRARCKGFHLSLYLLSFQILMELGSIRLRWATPARVLIPLAFTLVRLPVLPSVMNLLLFTLLVPRLVDQSFLTFAPHGESAMNSL